MSTMGEVKPKQKYCTEWERLDLLKPQNMTKAWVNL